MLEDPHCLFTGGVVESDIDVESTRSSERDVEIVGKVGRCKEYRILLQNEHDSMTERYRLA